MPRRFDGISQTSRPVSKDDFGIRTESEEGTTDEELSLEEINDSVDATPGAKQIATENGVNLREADIDGSGENGRIWVEDIERYIANQPAP